MAATHRKRRHLLGALGAAALLAVEILGVGAQPASGTGQVGLTVQFTGNGSGNAVTSDGKIDCAFKNGVVVLNRCDFQGYPIFTKVTLTVTAFTGSALCDNDFVCHAEGETDKYDLTLSGPTIWNGFLGLQNRYVTVLKAGPGSGTVTSTDGKISCPASCQTTAEISYVYGDPVTLQAVAASGSAFDSWSGACASQGATCHFTMTDLDPESAITATFKVKATPTPTPAHTSAPAKSATPDVTAAAGTTAPTGVASTTNDPGASPAGTADAQPTARTTAGSTDPSPSVTSTPSHPDPTAAPASLDTGWIAFLLLLVLVIGVSVGGAIAFVVMRRRPPRAS